MKLVDAQSRSETVRRAFRERAVRGWFHRTADVAFETDVNTEPGLEHRYLAVRRAGGAADRRLTILWKLV